MASLRTLLHGFIESAARHPARPALELGEAVLTYGELNGRAAGMARTLDRHALAEPRLTAVFARRSVTAYAGVLAALGRGHAFVPLNPSFPVERTSKMLARSTAMAVVVDASSAPQLEAILDGQAPGMTVLLPDLDDASQLIQLAARFPQHNFLSSREIQRSEHLSAGHATPEDIAYLLFTSGSTGEPKGVAVAHCNVTHFLDVMVDRYQVSENDRFSQTFDLTFDLSVFDMFMAWERGACLCAPTHQEKLLPAKYVQSRGITIWFSVPSTAVLMNRLRLLRAGVYPNLRLSLFCGEALPVEVIHAWSVAAPNSTIENLYGPTELTIACTLYRWDGERSVAECERGIVPIGEPYPGMKVLIATPELREVEPGEAGELLMTGPQLTPGYWNDPARTARAFVQPPGYLETYYRTGDLVRRPRSTKDPIVYLGRIDNQIKIQGYRVELGEVEAALRREARVDAAVAIGWPQTASGADSIVGFVAGSSVDESAIVAALRSSLPSYMQVSRVIRVDEFPLNSNGKIDRGALRYVRLGKA